MEVTQLSKDGAKKRKLSCIVDYTIGLSLKGLDMFKCVPSKDLHVIAIEAKVSWESDDFYKCVAETATLYQARKDAVKSNCSIWVVLSNVRNWQFIHIDNDGLLCRSDEFYLILHQYNGPQVLKVYSFQFILSRVAMTPYLHTPLQSVPVRVSLSKYHVFYTEFDPCRVS